MFIAECPPVTVGDGCDGSEDKESTLSSVVFKCNTCEIISDYCTRVQYAEIDLYGRVYPGKYPTV